MQLARNLLFLSPNIERDLFQLIINDLRRLSIECSHTNQVPA